VKTKPAHQAPFAFTQEGGISVLRDATGRPIGRVDRKADAAYIAFALQSAPEVPTLREEKAILMSHKLDLAADRDRLLAVLEEIASDRNTPGRILADIARAAIEKSGDAQ
jgi:hypothetical protein